MGIQFDRLDAIYDLMNVCPCAEVFTSSALRATAVQLDALVLLARNDFDAVVLNLVEPLGALKERKVLQWEGRAGRSRKRVYADATTT